MSRDLMAILAPLLLPALGAVAVSLLGRRRPHQTRLTAAVASGLASLAALPLAPLALPWPVSQAGERLILAFYPWTPQPLPQLGITFVADAVSASFLLIVLLAATAFHLSALTPTSDRSEASAPVIAAELLLTGAGVAFVLAGDPLTLYLGWALMELAVFAIGCAHAGDGNLDEPVRALGVSVILGLPLLVLAVISRPGMSWDQSATTMWPAVTVTGLMFAAGARLGAYPAPLRPAVPEPKAALHSPLTTLLPTTGGAYLVLRALVLGEGQVPGGIFWATVGALAVTAGGFLAWRQRDARAGLSWVVVTQGGLLLVAAGLEEVTQAVAVLQALTLCLASTLMYLWLESQRALEQPSSFWMRGMGWLAVANLLGIPPTVGFVARWALYRHLVEASAWPLVTLLAVATAWTVPPLLGVMSPAPDRSSQVNPSPTRGHLRAYAGAAGVSLVGVILLVVGLQPLLLLAPLRMLMSLAYDYLSQVIRGVDWVQGAELVALLVLPLLGGYALTLGELAPGRVTNQLEGFWQRLASTVSLAWAYQVVEWSAWRLGTLVQTLTAPLEGKRYWGWTFLYALLVALLLLTR